ncbi:MAG: sigma-54-dependent Fis family transcriptional regulator, partial [Phycisphaerae bacterium]|nr:sigma-54-dependent Fis family transcriptional regulator [Phycisphaerae bacterium]
RGSFTGAVALRKGWFERADEGTLFLDEVGELPLAAQVRLLRILQDGTFERVGGEKPLKVDVRIVAATHRDLQSMVAEGTFRADLWYRMAVFPIELPSLRDRPEDMPALATHFALRAAKRFGLPILTPTPEDIHVLLAYDWPGNIRELASVINRAAILGNGRRLEIAKALWGAPAPPRAAAETPRAEPTPAPAPIPAPIPTPVPPPVSPATKQISDFPTLDAAIANHIETALKMTHGRIEGPFGAAKLLRVNPHTLRARMRKLKVDWKRFRPPPSSD